MLRLIASENDYSTLTALPEQPPELTVAVVIPVYNRASLLIRTLAGLATQTYPRHLWTVVVADDGSTEDIEAAVAEARLLAEPALDIKLTRRENLGYGAGQARTQGAQTSDADLIVFIDADCVPDPDLIAKHAAWHHKASNLVVIGARHGLDTTDITPETLARDGLPAGTLAQRSPSDFRNVFYRRTAELRSGDEAYRSLVSSNFSIRRQGFLDIGGFADSFSRWGGEDTELGWRLFAGGYFFVPENSAVIFHQTQEDGEEGWRSDARAANDGQIQNLIPHRFYRKSKPGHIYAVPKVSWIVTPTPAGRAEIVWDELLGQNHTDFEALFVGSDLDAFVEENQADPRVRVAPDTLAALRQARGEYVAVVHGWASLDHRLMARAVRRLDSRPRTSLLTVGYDVPGADGPLRLHRPSDVAEVDAVWSESGLPVFAIARRREWSKALGGQKSVAEAWDLVADLSETQHLASGLVALPAVAPSSDLNPNFSGFVGDRSQLVADLRESPGVGSALPHLARFAVTRLQRKPYQPHVESASTPAAPRGNAGRPRVRYVGWSGNDNLGDETMLAATSELLDWADLSTSGEASDLLLLGGGTLINRKSYLRILREKDSPRVERAVLGTGVAHPDYWGITEDTQAWVDFLSSCVYVGVRGPRSAALLREWGYSGPLEVVGDPALALTAPADSPPRDRSHVVISPAWTRGELWGGDDALVYDALAELIRRFAAEGRPLTMLSCFPADDRHIIKIMRQAGQPDMAYVAGYEDSDAALRLLAGAGIVIAERLHAAILAAACGTPFVGLEYRPKLRDFGASMDLDRFIIRTDRLAELPEVVDQLETEWATVAETINEASNKYRRALSGAAATIRKAVE